MAPTLTSIRLLTALIPLFLNIPSTLASSSPLTFPLVPDKSFHLVPAEELVQSILGVWGINIQLDLAIDLGLTNVDLGVDLGSRSRFEERRSRLRVGVDSAVTRDSERTQEKRGLLGFNAGSGWGLFGSPGSTGGGGLSATVATVLPTTSQSTAAGVATASAKSSAPLTLNVGTNVDLDAVVGSSMNGYLDLGLGLGSGSQGWGEAENVAKGEQGDTEWFTYISIGNPPQSLPVLPDTGSSDLFIFGSDCSSCNLANHTAFDPGSSSTFTNLTQRWGTSYADGSNANGYAALETISFGASTSANANADSETGIGAKLALGIATGIAGPTYLRSARSGIMGLAQDTMSSMPGRYTSEGATLFSKLVRGGKLDLPVLSIRLEKGQSGKGVMVQEGGGMYMFGGIEDEYVVGGRDGLVWADVTSGAYWGIGLDDIAIGLHPALSSNDTTYGRAIIDTGTTLIITSDAIATSIHAQITGSFRSPSSAIWYIPCTTSYPASPNLHFRVGGRMLGVPVEDLAWKVSAGYEGMCISGVQGGMPHFTVLGTVFLKNQYVVLSYGSSKTDALKVGLGVRTDVELIV